jgi:hypothetical protein
MRECDLCGERFESSGRGLSVSMRGIFGDGVDDDMIGTVGERERRQAFFDVCHKCLASIRSSIMSGSLPLLADTMLTELVKRGTEEEGE